MATAPSTTPIRPLSPVPWSSCTSHATGATPAARQVAAEGHQHPVAPDSGVHRPRGRLPALPIPGSTVTPTGRWTTPTSAATTTLHSQALGAPRSAHGRPDPGRIRHREELEGTVVSHCDQRRSVVRSNLPPVSDHAATVRQAGRVRADDHRRCCLGVRSDSSDSGRNRDQTRLADGRSTARSQRRPVAAVDDDVGVGAMTLAAVLGDAVVLRRPVASARPGTDDDLTAQGHRHGSDRRTTTPSSTRHPGRHCRGGHG